MNRHDMQREVEYLLSGLCREREKWRRAEREREKREREGRVRSCFAEQETEKIATHTTSGRQICLPQRTVDGVDIACLLKGQNRSLQSPLIILKEHGPTKAFISNTWPLDLGNNNFPCDKLYSIHDLL